MFHFHIWFTVNIIWHLVNWNDNLTSYNLEYALCLQGIGDLTLAYQCFKLTLAFNNDHAEAYNNLAVLELRKGHIEQVKT